MRWYLLAHYSDSLGRRLPLVVCYHFLPLLRLWSTSVVVLQLLLQESATTRKRKAGNVHGQLLLYIVNTLFCFVFSLGRHDLGPFRLLGLLPVLVEQQ